jgi:hypothetical protein
VTLFLRYYSQFPLIIPRVPPGYRDADAEHNGGGKNARKKYSMKRPMKAKHGWHKG